MGVSVRSPALVLAQTLVLIALLSIVSCARRVSKVQGHSQESHSSKAQLSKSLNKVKKPSVSSTKKSQHRPVADGANSAALVPSAVAGGSHPRVQAKAESVLAHAAQQISAWASLRRQRPMLPISQRVDDDVIRVTLVSGRGDRIYDEHILSIDGRLLLQDAVELESVHHRLGAAHSWASCLDRAEVTLALPQAVSPQGATEQSQAKSLLGTFGGPLQKACIAGDQHCPQGTHVVWWIGSQSYQGHRSLRWLEALTSCKSPSH
ncbi:MAG TPA: hypothetical protein DCQ06_07575 [Myxococcales bacterium]|nr:hypothetical protein [Myxococcales bacterium]